MKTVQLAAYAAPYGGSFVPMLGALVREAHERGWGAEVALPERAADRPWVADLEQAGAPPALLGAGGRRGLAGGVAQLLGDAGEPTVLHSHFTDFDVAAALAARGRGRVAVVWHLHSRLEPGAVAWVRNAVKFRAVGRSVDRILCVAENIEQAVRARGAPRKRTCVWPNAIDVDRFAPPTPETRSRARGTLGLPDDADVVMHFGWDWHRKGGDLYVAAMERVASVPRPRPLVAATVVGENGVSAADTGEVRVLAPQERVQALYEAADVFVSCSRAEGMPFSMAEALASGLGVVASDIPGQVAIGDGVEACRLVRGDPDRIARAVEDLLAREPEEAEREGERAREHVRASMGVDHWAARTADLYEELVGSQSRAS